MLHVLVHEPGQGVRALESTEEVRTALAAEGNVVWVDVEGRSAKSDAMLTDVFGFHPLAIEDVYKEQHRPKVEDYERYLYIIALGLRSGWSLEKIEFFEIDIFLGKNFVVTHHTGAVTEVTSLRGAVQRAESGVLEKGAVYLAHAILDRIVDRIRPLATLYLEEIDRVEERVLDGYEELQRILELRGGLQRLRRAVIVQREVLGRLARAEFDEIPKEAKPFFRDVHEHMAELGDGLDQQREELNAVFDAFHSLSAHRMNEIMKVLTLVSTIMLPLTFIVGVYGMNFDNMPELHWQFGYYGIWGLMLGMSLVMSLYFRWRGWF